LTGHFPVKLSTVDEFAKWSFDTITVKSRIFAGELQRETAVAQRKMGKIDTE